MGLARPSCQLNLKDVFSKKRATSSRKAQHLKCMASDALSLYPVMAHFVQHVLRPAERAPLACDAFIALADMLDVLVAVPLGIVTPALLRDRITRFIDCCLAAGWREYLHPKFHWLVHLSRHLHSFGMLPTCWVHERKHRVVKRFASDILNTVSYERSVLGEVTAHQLESLAGDSNLCEDVGLLDPKPAPPKMRLLLETELEASGFECLTSREARVSAWATCCKGDVVLVKDEDRFCAGQVCFHACYGGEHISLVSLWDFIKGDGTSAEWQAASNPILVETCEIYTSVISTRLREGVVRTLLPIHMRL